MRIFVALALGSLLMVGCGDDNGGTGGGGGSDLSVQVSWEPVMPCVQFTPSDWEVTVEVTDEVGTVTVDGDVTTCTPRIDKLGVNTINCFNNAPYPGTVTVRDDVGTDQVDFMIGNCMSGSAP